MNKAQLVNEISKMNGASKQYLNTRSVAQLKETYNRWVAITSTTKAEIKLHCNINFKQA